MPDNKGCWITDGWTISTLPYVRVHIYIYIYEIDRIMHHGTSEMTAELP